jgi:hypothetical protein
LYYFSKNSFYLYERNRYITYGTSDVMGTGTDKTHFFQDMISSCYFFFLFLMREKMYETTEDRDLWSEQQEKKKKKHLPLGLSPL